MKPQKTLAGQSLKALFVMNIYLHKFTYLKPSHVLDLFDKLITPILNYETEVWGFHKTPYTSIFVRNYWGSSKVHKTTLNMGD